MIYGVTNGVDKIVAEPILNLIYFRVIKQLFYEQINKEDKYCTFLTKEQLASEQPPCFSG